MLLDIGGIVINLDNLVSFKVNTTKDKYFLQIFMIDGSGYNIEYSNVEHFLRDVKTIQKASRPRNN